MAHLKEHDFWQYAFEMPDGEMVIIDGHPRWFGYAGLRRRRMTPVTDWTPLPESCRTTGDDDG